MSQIVRVDVVGKSRSLSHLRQSVAELLGDERSAPGRSEDQVIGIRMRRGSDVPACASRGDTAFRGFPTRSRVGCWGMASGTFV